MPRFVGVLPVFTLSVAAAISAVVGLGLSHASTPSIAVELGCTRVSSSRPEAGVDRQTCLYHGDPIAILTLSHGPHTLLPPELTDNFVVGSRSGRVWVVTCLRRVDCVDVERKVGGNLTSGPVLGLSIVG